MVKPAKRLRANSLMTMLPCDISVSSENKTFRGDGWSLSVAPFMKSVNILIHPGHCSLWAN